MLMLQSLVKNTINVSAGGLFSKIDDDERSKITHLTLTGTIDARDFETIRENLPSLIAVDLSYVHIVPLTEKGGRVVVIVPDLNTGEVKISVKHGSGEDYINKIDEVPTIAFCGKRELTSIILPSTVTAINSNAFMACRRLTSFTIPEKVTRIEDGAFKDCSSLKTIIVRSAIPVDLSKNADVFEGVPKNSCTLFVPVGSKGKYELAAGWKDFKNIVELE